jgi:hypothetical protein
METVVVVVIITAAAAYMVYSLFRSASTGKKSCGCEDGCPISKKCAPEDSRCVVTENHEEVAR